jgi:DNA-binding beta-propeller fold protein YncE
VRRVAVLIAALFVVVPAQARTTGGTAVALVTAETQNELLAVSMPPGHVLRRVHVAADPQNVAAVGASAVIVVSTRSHAVTVLTPQLKIVHVFRSFRAPHLAAIFPDGKHVYVTDDATGRLTVIDLTRPSIVARVFVGVGAHHLALSPDGNRAWIALGEHARSIVILDTASVVHPRVIGRLDPGFAAHDLGFDPADGRVWVTSDSDDSVRVFSAATHRVAFSVAVGPPPQHVAFGPLGQAYLASGYGSRIVAASRFGSILRTGTVPYGSFNIATAGDFVVTSSLLRGTVTELNAQLHIVGTMKVAPAARDVAISTW